ncbi:ABC transporter permease [Streptomyces mirabilis]
MSELVTRTVVEEAAPTGVEPPAQDLHPNRTRAVIALARFEARELLMQIPMLVFLLLYVAYTGWGMFNGREGMDDYPVLHDVDRSTQTAPLLLALVLFVSINRAVLRSRRHGTDRHFDVLVMEPWRRSLAHALSAVPFAVFTALVVGFEFTWAALKPGAVGHGSLAELLVGPLSILLAGALGVLVARSIPFTFAVPPFVIVMYVLTTLLAASTQGTHWVRWLAPVVTEEGAHPFPADLLGRPAAWHVLYLVGLIVLLLCLALLINGGRTPRIKAITVLALAAMAQGIAGQAPGDSAALIAARAKASATPEKVQTCVTHERSTYCAYPEWNGQTADWAEVVQRVQSLAGGPASAERLTVRQRVDARSGLEGDAALEPAKTPGVVTVGTRWGGNRIPEFAVGVASVLVTGDEASSVDVCDARAVLIMWLALGSESHPLTMLRHVRIDDSITGGGLALAPTNPISMNAAQTEVIKELLQKPRYSVIPKVKAHWSELTSPKTTTAQVAQLLGVPAPTDPGALSVKTCGE